MLERGGHRRAYVYERCEIRLCYIAVVAVVPPLLYFAHAFEIQRKCKLV